MFLPHGLISLQAHSHPDDKYTHRFLNAEHETRPILLSVFPLRPQTRCWRPKAQTGKGFWDTWRAYTAILRCDLRNMNYPPCFLWSLLNLFSHYSQMFHELAPRLSSTVWRNDCIVKKNQKGQKVAWTQWKQWKQWQYIPKSQSCHIDHMRWYCDENSELLFFF